MTRNEIDRALRHAENLRMDSYEAETEKDRRRMIREYNLVMRQIAPFVLGNGDTGVS